MVQLPTNQEGQLKMTDHGHNGTYWNSSDFGQASEWNRNITIPAIITKLEDITIDANFAWLLFSLLIAVVWFTYITHYSSRVIGQILTRLLNRFVVGSGYVRIGNLIAFMFCIFAAINFFIFKQVPLPGMHWLGRSCFVTLCTPQKISVLEFRMVG